MWSLMVGGRPCHALVVDDNFVNRHILEVMLTGAGATVSQCEDGDEACAAFENGRFDIVLMDVAMPKMDGLTAIRCIRALELARGQARTPIFVVSAFTASDDVRASSEAGADLHFGKPIDMRTLLDAVSATLEGATPQAADPRRYFVR